MENILVPRFPLTRNWVTDAFMDGILRGDNRDPASMKKEYVQWQRGAISKTPVEEMTGWVDKSLATGHMARPRDSRHRRNRMGAGAGRQHARLSRLHEGSRDRLWVATFADAAKYARERMASR